MKILTAQQTRDLDAHTIKNEPIASIDLMERASTVFADWFCKKFPQPEAPVHLFCGLGNNGGDGLAVARILLERAYDVRVIVCRFAESGSEDFEINRQRLEQIQGSTLTNIVEGAPLPPIDPAAIIIDAIFGSGLNRPVEGYWADLFAHLNQSGAKIVSIDIPSGLFADQATSGKTVQADHTLTFELPKLAFLFPENQDAVGQWTYRSIGLSKDFLQEAKTSNFYVDRSLVESFFKKRKKFDHKGNFGHAILIAGSYGKAGAAILSARAGLRSGLGLLTVHAPRCAYEILQISVPEAMVSIDRHRHFISEWPKLDNYDAVGLGPGIGQGQTTQEAILQLVHEAKQPLVVDADGLNILSKHPEYIAELPEQSILTPHPKEFERLFGATNNDFERNALQREMAQTHRIILILKGAHTCIALPNGECYFNSTGNPGMATGGSGDVLTGIITGLMAQRYAPEEASILGVYIHGLAGDLAVKDLEHQSLVAGDLVRYLGKAFVDLSEGHNS